MYKFDPVGDFQIEDLSREENIEFLTGKVDIQNNTDVLLEIRKCYIDYPTTGVLLNFLLTELAKLEGKKTLNINYDFHLPEYDLLACLFDECSFFDSTNFKELEYDNLLEIINAKLKSENMSVVISLYKLFSAEVKVLNYGV